MQFQAELGFGHKDYLM